jgi:hypothetical protein
MFLAPWPYASAKNGPLSGLYLWLWEYYNPKMTVFAGICGGLRFCHIFFPCVETDGNNKFYMSQLFIPV